MKSPEEIQTKLDELKRDLPDRIRMFPNSNRCESQIEILKWVLELK